MEGFFATITVTIQTFVALIGTITAGTVLTYFILPHVAGHIHANIITLIWVTLLLVMWTYYLSDSVGAIVIAFQYMFSLLMYHAIPYSYATRLLDIFYVLFSLWVVYIALHPHVRHTQHK